MWDAWPLQKTFVDGRALNESVFQDYMKIALNYRDAQSLLDKYGVQVLLLEGFEYWRGTVYMLSAALADPNQTKWKLVYPGQDRDDLHAPAAAGRTAAEPRGGLHQPRGAVHGSPAARAGQAGLRCRSGRSLHAGWAIPIAPPRGAPPTIRSSTEPSMPPRPAKPKARRRAGRRSRTRVAPSAPARADRDPVPHLVHRRSRRHRYLAAPDDRAPHPGNPRAHRAGSVLLHQQPHQHRVPR